ncbi:WD40/YVTN/BNR-like repeat-containing protein [Terrimonas pollutisoli]|uniref:WD40/YVTN/BNR-like repeat-containing protein n=1 Tax=Terrimonas pollutisoli TaxID=3034147 RepID=UPI0023EBC216|nr:oxidoreductase [Terrimonas sp. H1YJ31]
MKKLNILFLFLFIVGKTSAQSPSIEILTSGTKTSLRGLSVVNDNIIWVSGSNGTVGKSVNGGKNWKWMTVNGFEKTEFRDIEAFDANIAIIMGIADPAYILKTNNGGESWRVVYENKTKGMFLDAMDFANSREGIVVGDPINGKIFIAKTNDTGNTWTEIEENANRPVADSGEAFFASSGSNIKLFSNDDYFIVSGGLRSRLITNSNATDLPLIQGKESTGANSIDIYDEGIPDKPGQRMIIVGGDFSADSITDKNCVYSLNGGKKWLTPVRPPHGYRSSVEFLSKKDVLACGLNGVDYSKDAGKNWKWISKEGFHVCRIARIGTAIFLAGNNGKIGKVQWK